MRRLGFLFCFQDCLVKVYWNENRLKCYIIKSYLCTDVRRQLPDAVASPNEVVNSKNQVANAVTITQGNSSSGTTQLRTVASLVFNLLKSTTPFLTIPVPGINIWKGKLQPQDEKLHPTDVSIVQENYASKLVLKKENPSHVNVLNGNTKEGNEVFPQWKIKPKSINQEMLDHRTKYVVSAVAKATSKRSLLMRLEDFCLHVFQYPEAKSLATREGAISMLLRLKHSTPKDELIQRQIREGLALLGHANPLPARGIRILSIDGGGIRGLVALRILKHLEERVGRPIHSCFDYICGVSTGAILALLLGANQKSVSEVEKMYLEMSGEVFRQDRSSGLSGLLWSHAYYNTEKWEKILKNAVGEMVMIRSTQEPNCPKVAAVSSIANQEVVRAYVFRNYSLPHRIQSQYRGSYRHKAWEAVRASSAAPGYFEEFKLEESVHQDGGLLVNNPCAVAIHEAKCIWPTAELQAVVSIGTGRYQPTEYTYQINNSDPTISSWKQKLMKLIDSATDTERVHAVLHDLLPPRVYYRFNPYLSEAHSIDETDPFRINRMLEDVDMYIRKNQRKITEAANTLNIKRTTLQNMKEWMNERRYLIKNLP